MRKYIFYFALLFILSLIIISCFELKLFNNKKIIYASDEAAHDSFGQASSISGEYLIVGATTANSSQGQAYIFKNNGNNNWNEITKLEASDKSDNDFFGYSVSVFGKHVIVGAPGSDSQKGQVYIFKNVGANNWKEIDILKPGNQPYYMHFGMDVSISGKYAISSTAIGTSDGEKRGQVYIFY